MDIHYRKSTDFLVVHCSATPPSADVGVKEITQWHKARDFETIGYHYVIRRNGNLEIGRPMEVIGAHVKGYNHNSIGICMVGGVKQGEVDEPENNFAPEQFDRLWQVLCDLKKIYPSARILGHRDLSPDLNHDGVIEQNEWLKACPSFDVTEWLATKDAVI